MAKKRFTKNSGLTKKTALSAASSIVIDVKLFNLVSSINKYFEEESVENLHSIRITLRRVRYSLEIFTICFNRKKYLSLYKKIEKLQDLSGEVRDLDVLTDNMNKLQAGQKIKISVRIFKSIESKRSLLKEKLKLELMQFLHSKSLKDFQSLLKDKNIIKK